MPLVGWAGHCTRGPLILTWSPVSCRVQVYTTLDLICCGSSSLIDHPVQSTDSALALCAVA
jgi:hypothetical protein